MKYQVQAEKPPSVMTRGYSTLPEAESAAAKIASETGGRVSVYEHVCDYIPTAVRKGAQA